MEEEKFFIGVGRRSSSCDREILYVVRMGSTHKIPGGFALRKVHKMSDRKVSERKIRGDYMRV